jgi:hypothetical protein
MEKIPAHRTMSDRIRAILRRDEPWIFLAFVVLYGLAAGHLLKHPSIAPYYVYLAESFLEGHTYLVTPPPTGYDLLAFGGRQYIAGGPLPALVFMPFVWLRGTPAGFPDAAVTCVWGACNVVLVYALLGRLRRWMRISRGTRLALAVVFGAGTPHWYVASLGTVWFTAHICAVTCVCLYTREVLGRNRAWLAGLWLGLAGLARPTCWFAFPFFVMTALARRRQRHWARQLVPEMLAFWSVPLACVGLTLLYNVSRFGHPLDFGLSYINGAKELVELQARYGSFNLHFAPRNLRHMLVGLPDVCLQNPPWLHPDPVGMSIFLVTPPLLYIFKSLHKRRLATWLRLLRTAFRRPIAFLPRILHVRPPVGPAWLCVLSVSLPLALYHNTGSFQFGYRYILDWLPIGLILVATGMKGTMSRWKWGLVAASVLINLGGLLWVYPTFNLRSAAWHVQWVALIGRLWNHVRDIIPPR